MGTWPDWFEQHVADTAARMSGTVAVEVGLAYREPQGMGFDAARELHRRFPQLRPRVPSGRGVDDLVLWRAAERVLGRRIAPAPMWLVGLHRGCRRERDPDRWRVFAEAAGLGDRTELRSMDSFVDGYGDGERGTAHCRSLEEALACADGYEPGAHDYLQLYVDAHADPAPPVEHPRLELLGYDLSDRTHTSSLFNCGEWAVEADVVEESPQLAPLVELHARRNRYGLLSYDDACTAQAVLPHAWNGDPHSWCTVWALYEVHPSITPAGTTGRDRPIPAGSDGEGR